MYPPISFLIVEDNRIDELALLSLTNQFAALKHIGTASNTIDAIAFVNSTRPDLVFMDIDIPGLSGLELARRIKSIVPICIFVTSHGEYALDGFELSALDYVVKPFTSERFAQTYKRLTEYREMKQQALAYEALIEKESLFIKEGYEKIRLLLSDIIYLEAMQDYTKVVTSTKKHMVNMPLSRFLEQFNDNIFLRIHRSYALLPSQVRELKTNEIIIKNGYCLPIGKTYRFKVQQSIL